MTAYTVSVTPEAESDIGGAILWYRERSPLAADALRAEIFAAIEDLSVNANIWPIHDGGVHRRLLKRYPYTVYYEIADCSVVILAVAHQRRFPDFWRDR